MKLSAALLLAGVALGAVEACAASGDSAGSSAAPPSIPAALDSVSPVRYPAELFDQAIDGDVMLRLFVDATGRLVPESTKVVTSSGRAAFDSAAVRGAALMRFAPAQPHGVPVAMAFLQPIRFRHPGQP